MPMVVDMNTMAGEPDCRSSPAISDVSAGNVVHVEDVRTGAAIDQVLVDIAKGCYRPVGPKGTCYDLLCCNTTHAHSIC